MRRHIGGHTRVSSTNTRTGRTEYRGDRKWQVQFVDVELTNTNTNAARWTVTFATAGISRAPDYRLAEVIEYYSRLVNENACNLLTVKRIHGPYKIECDGDWPY